MAELLQYQSSGAFGRDLAQRQNTAARLVKSGSLLLAWTAAAIAAMIAFTPLGGLAIIIVISYLMRSIRRRRALAVLGYLEQAVRMNMPLGRILRAAQQSETGGLALRLFRLRESIEAGAPLGIALEMDVPEMPERTIRLIRSAERLGRLPAMLTELLAQERKRDHDTSGESAFSLAYPLVLMAVIVATTTMLMVFVMPKYQQILKDLEVSMPVATEWLMWVALGVGPLLVVLVGLALALYAGVQVSAIFRKKETPLFAWWDWPTWWTPLIGSAARDRGMADVCHVLAEALRVGHTLERALLEAGQLPINEVLRQRVIHWQTLVHHGMDIAEAARQAKMPQLLVGMLGTVRQTTSAADAFEFLARYYRGRFSRLALLIKGSLVPTMTILFGLLVCGIALSLFLPIMRMVDANLNWGKL